jgi:hypothetical protein
VSQALERGTSFHNETLGEIHIENSTPLASPSDEQSIRAAVKRSLHKSSRYRRVAEFLSDDAYWVNIVGMY